MPNTPRPGSNQLYFSRHGFSPNRSLNTQSGPTPAGFNSPGHSNDSNLSIYSSPSVRTPVRDGLLGGQPRGQPVGVEHIPDHTSTRGGPVRDGLLGGLPRGQPVRVQHLPDHANTSSFTLSCGTIISGTYLPAMQISDCASYVTRSHLLDLQCASRDQFGTMCGDRLLVK